MTTPQDARARAEELRARVVAAIEQASPRQVDRLTRMLSGTQMQEWQRQWDEGVAEAERDIAENGCPF